MTRSTPTAKETFVRTAAKVARRVSANPVPLRESFRKTRSYLGWIIALAILPSAPAVAQCAGDCNESDSVAVNELATGLNIALGRAPLDTCASFDIDGNDQIAVDELVTAVSNALDGCGFAARYTATVALDDAATGQIELRATSNHQIIATVTIPEPAIVRSAALGQAQASATLSGQFDPTTGSFLVTGTIPGPGGDISIRLSGQLGSGFTLEIDGRGYNGSFDARPTPTRTPTRTATPPGAMHVIKVGQPVLPFDPEVLEIDPGDTVTWMWVAGPHSVRSAALNAIARPSCNANGLFDSGIKSSGTFSYTFTTPGRYGFHCGVTDHCERFEFGYIDVRGTPTPTASRTPTRTRTVAIPTPTPTPETIGGVSTRMLGFFSGLATVGTQSYPARLQILVDDGGVLVSDLSAIPTIFPNPVRMMVLSTTSISYQSAGPPPIAFTLSLNAQAHLVGSYVVTDPIMPHLPTTFDLTREG